MKGAPKTSKSRDQTNGTPIFIIHYRTFSLTKVNILCIQEIIQKALLKNILKWSSYWSAFFLIVLQFYITVFVSNVHYNVDKIQLLLCSFLIMLIVTHYSTTVIARICLMGFPSNN